MSLSDKFSNYQQKRKKHLYYRDHGVTNSQEYHELLYEVVGDEEYEQDLATFSQLGNIEIQVAKHYDLSNTYQTNEENMKYDKPPEFRRTIRVQQMELEASEEPLSTQNSKVEIPEVGDSIPKVAIKQEEYSESAQGKTEDSVLQDLTNTDNSKYSIRDHLEKIWCPQYGYELYVIELNKLCAKYGVSNEQILNMAY